MHKPFFLTLAVAALLNTGVFADSLTHNQHLTFTGTAFQPSAGGQNNHYSYQCYYLAGWQLNWNHFDSSLGTLESMDWTIDFSWSANSHFVQMSGFGPASSGSANETFSMQDFRIGNYCLDGRILYETAGLPSDSDSVFTPIGGSGDGSLLIEGTLSKHVTDANLLSDFLNGFIPYIDAKAMYWNTGSYASGSASSPYMEVDLSYTFNYSPSAVPEPSTMVLLPIAGFFAWAIRRRVARA